MLITIDAIDESKVYDSFLNINIKTSKTETGMMSLCINYESTNHINRISLE